jgi:hypothetical protein
MQALKHWPSGRRACNSSTRTGGSILGPARQPLRQADWAGQCAGHGRRYAGDPVARVLAVIPAATLGTYSAPRTHRCARWCCDLQRDAHPRTFRLKMSDLRPPFRSTIAFHFPRRRACALLHCAHRRSCTWRDVCHMQRSGFAAHGLCVRRRYRRKEHRAVAP